MLHECLNRHSRLVADPGPGQLQAHSVADPDPDNLRADPRTDPGTDHLRAHAESYPGTDHLRADPVVDPAPHPGFIRPTVIADIFSLTIYRPHTVS